MNQTTDVDRRTVLRSLGAVAVAGAIAGCGGDGGGGGSEDGSDGSDGDSGSGGVPGDVEEYLSDTDNFDGSLEDATGQGEVTVQTGTEANGGNFGFGPAAVRIDSGTTVVWEWTGEGASHNVVDEDGAFESELTDEEGFTFEHTFEDSGTVLYFCTPHKAVGMKGAVVVE